MALSLQEIRDYVRNHMELAIEDLPDAVLDVFIREASRKVESSEQRWPFYETSATYQTVAGTGTVAFDDLAENLKRVAEIYDGESGHQLSWISISDGERMGSQTGRPHSYSEWGEQLRLFPTPDGVYSLKVYGYRNQTDWISQGAGALPDMPEPLHNTVALWALHRAYAQQEDLEQASLYKALFDQELNELGRRLTEMPLTRPLVMNGRPAKRRSRPLFDWEV